MRHHVAGRKFDRPTAARMAMYRNLVTSLLENGKIVTTLAKAKEIQAMSEQMITLGKKGDLNARRAALAFIYKEDVVNKVFDEYAKRFESRNGGYTRISKLTSRVGDGAKMAQIELVD